MLCRGVVPSTWVMRVTEPVVCIRIPNNRILEISIYSGILAHMTALYAHDASLGTIRANLQSRDSRSIVLLGDCTRDAWNVTCKVTGRFIVLNFRHNRYEIMKEIS